MRRLQPTLLALAFLVCVTGCVRRVPNPPLTRVDPAKGYYFHTHRRPNNSPDTLLILCFSGGGTRAAALSFGVLEELRKTELGRAGLTNRLLDEVDAISAVSGGSVTAAAYALYGDEVFDRLEHAFLKRDIQTELLWRTLNPFRWGKLMSKTYGRSELAADLYDEVLFRGATFGDLSRRPGAFVAINATDVSSGARFSYTQYHFDLLCADLAPLRVSSAVAASSAVPGLLSAVTLNNYAGTCDCDLADAVRKSANGQVKSVVPRARFHFAELASYLDRDQQPYIHLVDGGVSDNLGIRSVLDGIYAAESHPSVNRLYDLSRIERVAIVVVNAYSKPDRGWALHEISPGTLTLAVEAASIPMDRYSHETVELLKEQIERWRLRQILERSPSSSTRKEVRFFPIVVDFSAIKDPQERRYFMDQPTSFVLPPESVDRLRDIGGRLLRDSPAYRALLTELRPAAP